MTGGRTAGGRSCRASSSTWISRIDFRPLSRAPLGPRALRALHRFHGPLPRRRRAALVPGRADLGRNDARRRRARARARARDPGVPRDLGRGLAQGLAARGYVPRSLRQRNRLARHPPQRRDPARRVSRSPDQGGARHRRPALLRAFRHRLAGHDARDGRQYARRRRGAGRLLDLAAARQEPVPLERAHHRAQGERGVPRGLAGSPALQERHPQALSRPRLSRRRHLRRRRRRAVLFQQVGARRDPRGVGDARRPVQGAVEIRAAHQPAGGARPRQRRARQPGRGRVHDRRPGVRRAAQSFSGGRPPRRALAQLLSRLGVRRDEEARRHAAAHRHRPRVRGAARDRSEPAAAGGSGGRKFAAPARPRI